MLGIAPTCSTRLQEGSKLMLLLISLVEILNPNKFTDINFMQNGEIFFSRNSPKSIKSKVWHYLGFRDEMRFKSTCHIPYILPMLTTKWGSHQTLLR